MDIAKTKAPPPYPCEGCVWVARCDNAARRLRAAARKEAQCRNND